MSQTSPPDQETAWSRYWVTGVLHSCPGTFHQNYADDILLFWKDFLTLVPNHGSVLDVATGNGAVALLARDIAGELGRSFHIEGIDAASINPTEAAMKHGLSTEGMVFRSNTTAEKTGYNDQSFDAACSQYGIEYSEMELSIPELARILKPGGYVGLLMHHSDSTAALTSRAELAALTHLGEQTPLLDTARWLIERLIAAGPDADPMILMHDVQAKTQVELFGTQREAVLQHANNHAHAHFLADIATQASRILQYIPSEGVETASRNLDLLESAVRAHRARLQAMVSACLNEGSMSSFEQLLNQTGFVTKSRRLVHRQQSDLLGWGIVARRVGGDDSSHDGTSARSTSGK